jgi:hypothetical protein
MLPQWLVIDALMALFWRQTCLEYLALEYESALLALVPKNHILTAVPAPWPVGARKMCRAVMILGLLTDPIPYRSRHG